MILGIDPSGNFTEGKGISGWVLLCPITKNIVKFGAIDASTSGSQFEHWDRHIDLIRNLHKEYGLTAVVLEDYILYADKAGSQVNSRFETVKLIGIIEYICKVWGVSVELQTAVSVKRRWKNFLLVEKGFLEIKPYKHKNGNEYEFTYINGFKANDHTVDALRHAVHYLVFRVKGDENEDISKRRIPTI